MAFFKNGDKVTFSAGRGSSRGEIVNIENNSKAPEKSTALIRTHKGGNVVRKLSSLTKELPSSATHMEG